MTQKKNEIAIYDEEELLMCQSNIWPMTKQYGLVRHGLNHIGCT
jgi:hypothetical protein